MTQNTEANYYVSWRYPLTNSDKQPELPEDAEFETVEEIVELCKSHGVSALLKNAQGFTVGIVHTDGSYELS